MSMDSRRDRKKTSAHCAPEQTWRSVLRTTVVSWWSDNAPRLGASLAFYAIFSAAPLLIVAVLIVGLAYGPDAAEGHIAEQLKGVMGEDAARGVQILIVQTHQASGGPLATALSIVALLVGASSAFIELQSALNVVWKVRPKPAASWWMTIKHRALAYVLVICIGVLILGLLVASSSVTAVWQVISDRPPLAGAMAQAFNFLSVLVVETFLFAMIFKFLPDAHIAWRDVWLGSMVTATLVGVGNQLIGFYLGSIAFRSAYGAAGSLAIFLLWTYYSALMFYLGAEFTQVYARTFGSHIVPESNAEEVPAAGPAK
jgi:membrane protein